MSVAYDFYEPEEPDAASSRAIWVLDADQGDRVRLPRRERTPGSNDPAVFPGRAATPTVLAHERKRERLISLIARFESHGLSSWVGRSAKIDRRTAMASEAFLQNLPSNRSLPKISPDGEGGLLLVWEADAKEALVVVYGFSLHLVKAPATAHTEYVDDLPFDGEVIPEQILASIP